MIIQGLTDAKTARNIEMTKYLLEMLGLRLTGNARIEEAWIQFWHVTRIIEWPWALSFFKKGDKVFDVGSDPLFSLLLLREGAEDITLHHTSVDVPNLGKALVYSLGWVTLKDVWKCHDDKLKMVYGYPHQLDLMPEIYDTVFNLSVMEHVEAENWHSWMESTWRLLKPGGTMVMTCDYLLHSEEGEPHGIINHRLNEFFDAVDCEFLTPTHHIPWHPDFQPSVLEGNEVLKITPDGQHYSYTVYGFAVRKNVKQIKYY